MSKTSVRRRMQTSYSDKPSTSSIYIQDSVLNKNAMKTDFSYVGMT
jgi:hypothetical protein